MPRARITPALPFAPLESLESIIHTIRGERVILDADLAFLYGTETKILNQAVRRNRAKFPPDFLFQLTLAEAEQLRRSRSQSVTLKRGANVKHAPFAFTEHGALMAANLLNSPQAVQMSVFVVRAFVKMRSLLTDTRELSRKLAALEADLRSRLDHHEAAITEFMGRLLQLLDPPPAPPPPPDKELGFHTTLRRPKRS
jgi:phage regulator Rha-like protein